MPAPVLSGTIASMMWKVPQNEIEHQRSSKIARATKCRIKIGRIFISGRAARSRGPAAGWCPLRHRRGECPASRRSAFANLPLRRESVWLSAAAGSGCCRSESRLGAGGRGELGQSPRTPGVLWKARPTISGPGRNEAFAHAAVKPDVSRHSHDVAVDVLAKVGDIVDESALQHQESARGIFDQFRVDRTGLDQGDTSFQQEL